MRFEISQYFRPWKLGLGLCTELDVPARKECGATCKYWKEKDKERKL